MRGFEDGAERFEAIAGSLDDEHPFGGVFDLAAPAVKAANFGDQIDAGGEMSIDQFVSDASRFFFRAARADYNNFFCHA